MSLDGESVLGRVLLLRRWPGRPRHHVFDSRLVAVEVRVQTRVENGHASDHVAKGNDGALLHEGGVRCHFAMQAGPLQQGFWVRANGDATLRQPVEA